MIKIKVPDVHAEAYFWLKDALRCNFNSFCHASMDTVDDRFQQEFEVNEEDKDRFINFMAECYEMYKKFAKE